MSYRFSITVRDVPADAVGILSTLDESASLPVNSDYAVLVGQDDVTVVKNRCERNARILVKGLEMRADGGGEGRLIFRHSRPHLSNFTLYKGREREFVLEAGASIVVRSDRARDPVNGQAVSV